MTPPWSRSFLLLLVVVLACRVPADPVRSVPDAYEREFARCDSLIAAGRYAACVADADSLLEQVEASEGRESVAVAAVIDRIVHAMIAGRQTRNPACRALAERALAIRRHAYGDEHPDVAESLADLGTILEYAREYPQAREAFERALDIRESRLPADDPAIARSLISLGNLRARLGEYDGVDDLYERALTILESSHGPDHPTTAGACLNFAIYCKLTGDYDRARRLNERALASFEAQLGPAHPRVARLLHNLGNLLVEAGELPDARRAYRRALAIRERRLGPDHPQIALTLEGLALLELRSGNLLDALDHARRAVTIRESAPGSSPQRIVQSQCVLASIEFYLGDGARAEQRAQRALARQIERLGEEHPRNAEILDLLGNTRSLVGDLASAIEHQRRALDIREACLPPGHPDLALGRRLLAAFLTEAGELQESRRLLMQALECDEAAGDNGRAALAGDLYWLARTTWQQGDPAEARRLLERCTAISAEVCGPDHPRHAARMRLLAMVLADAGRPADALALALEVERLAREQLRAVVRGLPETQALRYAAVRVTGLDLALSLLGGGEVAPRAVAPVWDELVRSRALILDEMAARRRRLAAMDDPRTARLRRDLAAATRELAWLVVASGLDQDEPDRARTRYERAYRRQQQLGRELARRGEDFRRERERSAVGLADVLAALPTGSGLVAYVRHRERWTLNEAATSDVGASSYGALVWTAGGGDPVFVPLGDAAAIDLLVSRWRDEVSRGLSVPGRPPEDAARVCRIAGTRLREAIWDPLAPMLAAVERVFMVPDGALDLIDFAALPGDAGLYLVEEGPLLHLVGAERDVVEPPPSRRSSGGLLAVGDPDFDADCATLSAMAREPAPPPAETATARGGGHERPDCAEFRELSFTRLPATSREIVEVSDLWAAAAEPSGAIHRLTGRAASEAAVKRLAGEHRSLHIATHGIFLGGQCRISAAGARGVGGLRPAGGDDAPLRVRHPLLVSGLALAGANTRREAGSADEDGILMAAEIATLDLAGVRWVVLSACDSGLGELQAGEGVLGLRRAFQVAGAATVVMSLWSVDDEMACRWMRELYHAHVAEGLATAEAVRSASRRLLAACRADGRSTHPHRWAGFIAVGDWR